MAASNLSRLLWLGFVFVLVLSFQPQLAAQSSSPRSFLDRSMKDEDVVVRFYYNPLVNGEGTAHSPLIFMPVSSQDPRLGTRISWILYLTIVDLRRVLHVLHVPQFLWKEAPIRKQLAVDPFDLPEPHHDSMEIAVTSSQGSATAELDANRVCDLFSEISNAVTNVKARNSLIFYRRTIDCLASGGPKTAPTKAAR